MIINTQQKPSEIVKYKFKDTLGYLPEKMSSKMYMQAYHAHHEYEVIENAEMGDFWSSAKKSISRAAGDLFRNAGGFLSKAISDIAKLPAQVVIVVKDVGSFTEDVYDASKKVAMQALPSELRSFVGTAIGQLEHVVTNPAETVSRIVETAGEIAHNIVRETSDAVGVVYREVGKPAFNIARNVANETIWQPIHKVADVAVLPLLPKSVRDKLNEVLDVPDAAFRGKLTDKDVLEGAKAYVQIVLIPSKIGLNLANDTINTLKKDAVLGPFLAKLDLYTGGLLTSAQNLAATPDDIYNDRNIDWKRKLIDGLKVYLATISAVSLARSTAITAVGTETGLAQTPIGRTALAVGVAYGSAYAGGNFASLTTQVGQEAVQSAVLAEVKAETVKEAVKKGWVDDATTARLILSAGGKFYNTVGTDKTLMDAMDEVHDKEFQSFVEHEIKKNTGLDVKYWQLVDLYNTDWAKLSDDLNKAMAKMVPTIGTSDGDFLSQMGKNFVDEMRRVPANFSNIGSNILDELQRTPENMAQLASAIAKEADRTPENVARIATNIAQASVQATKDAAAEAERVAQRAIAEAARTPENVVNIASNVATETARGATNVATTVIKAGEDIASEVARTPSNIVDAVSNISVSPPNIDISAPKIDISNLDDLIKKYGPDLLAYLQSTYGPNFPQMSFTPSQLSDIELNYNQTKKKSNAPLIMGLLAILGAGYFATQD